MTTLSTTHRDTPSAKTSEAPTLSRHALLERTLVHLRRAEPHAQAVVLLGLRLIYGWFFAQTGWGKLTNLERTSGFFESLGLVLPGFMAALVGTTELLGGILLVLGLGTRLSAAALSGVMLTALATAHADEAFSSLSSFTEQAPYPFLVATSVLLVFGAGRLSADHLACRAWCRRRDSKRADTTR